MSLLTVFIVVRKFPGNIRIDWENSVADYSTYASFDPLIKLLSNRYFAYQTMRTNDNAPKNMSALCTKNAQKKEKWLKAEKSSFSTVKTPPRAPYVIK